MLAAMSAPTCLPSDFAFHTAWTPPPPFETRKEGGRWVVHAEIWIAGFMRVVGDTVARAIELPSESRLEVYGPHHALEAGMSATAASVCCSLVGARQHQGELVIWISAAVFSDDGVLWAWSGDHVGDKPLHALHRANGRPVPYPPDAIARAKKLRTKPKT